MKKKEETAKIVKETADLLKQYENDYLDNKVKIWTFLLFPQFSACLWVWVNFLVGYYYKWGKA